MRYLTTAAILAVAFAMPVHAEELSGTLKKIKDTGAITLGIRDSAVPFSYIDEKQKIVGYADRHLHEDRRGDQARAQAGQARGQ